MITLCKMFDSYMFLDVPCQTSHKLTATSFSVLGFSEGHLQKLHISDLKVALFYKNLTVITKRAHTNILGLHVPQKTFTVYNLLFTNISYLNQLMVI